MRKTRKEPKPFYREFTQSWYVQIGKRQINLGPDKAEAFAEYHVLMTQRKTIRAADPAVVLIDRFLEWVQNARAATTYEWYRMHLASFAAFIGKRLKADDIRPHHVTEWVQKQHSKSAANTVHGAMRAVQRVFNWGCKQGYITNHPLIGLEKPTPTRREMVLDDVEFSAVLARATDQAERDLLTTLWETGCRVQEIRLVEAKHFDRAERRWVFPPSKSKGKQVSRVVYLSDTAFEISKRLAAQHPEGMLFRNRQGRQWTRNAIKCRFRKHGVKDLCGTVFRHSWITRALMSGVDPITVSVLAGHANLHMVANRYSHLAKRPTFLRDQLAKMTSTGSNA
jgi:integrase